MEIDHCTNLWLKQINPGETISSLGNGSVIYWLENSSHCFHSMLSDLKLFSQKCAHLLKKNDTSIKMDIAGHILCHLFPVFIVNVAFFKLIFSVSSSRFSCPLLLIHRIISSILPLSEINSHPPLPQGKISCFPILPHGKISCHPSCHINRSAYHPSCHITRSAYHSSCHMERAAVIILPLGKINCHPPLPHQQISCHPSCHMARSAVIHLATWPDQRIAHPCHMARSAVIHLATWQDQLSMALVEVQSHCQWLS